MNTVTMKNVEFGAGVPKFVFLFVERVKRRCFRTS